MISAPTQSDSELIRLCLTSSDKHPFRALVERYNPIVYNFIYRMTHNPELTSDLTQEVFLKTYRNLAKFDATRPFKPWILRIASNTTISEFRKNERQKHVEVSLNALEESGQWQESRYCTSDDASVEASAKYDQETILQAMETLEDNYKQALILRYSEDLSYEEIADALDVPLNTVRTWIRRGRERLQKELLKQKNEERS